MQIGPRTLENGVCLRTPWGLMPDRSAVVSWLLGRTASPMETTLYSQGLHINGYICCASVTNDVQDDLKTILLPAHRRWRVFAVRGVLPPLITWLTEASGAMFSASFTCLVVETFANDAPGLGRLAGPI